MPETTGGGYAVEYICRIIDETDGAESVPESAAVAQSNINGKNRTRESGKNGAKNASETKTSEYMKAALRVAMPALNAFTNGVVGQTVEKGGQIISLIRSLAVGSMGGAVSAGASLAAWGVGEIVQSILNARTANDALAQSIDDTNFIRQMAGLEKIEYTRSGLTGKVQFEEDR